MKSELAEKLRENHPIFTHHVSVGDGWYHIIDSMLTCIEYEIRHVKTNRDWRIKNNQLADLPEVPQVEFYDIKEKFGTMRVHCSGTNARISGIISMAEAISCYTCEDCGNSGKPRGSSWIRTLCNECFVERELTKD